MLALLALLSFCASVLGALVPSRTIAAAWSPSLVRRDPDFPTDIPSCQQCQANYGSINSCDQALPVLANFTEVIFNPGAFIDVLKCACTDTFQSTYPQCADCFERTNQTYILSNTTGLPTVVANLRKVCGLVSIVTGNASASDSTSSAAESPTPDATTAGASPPTSSSSAIRHLHGQGQGIVVAGLAASLSLLLVGLCL